MVTGADESMLDDRSSSTCGGGVQASTDGDDEGEQGALQEPGEPGEPHPAASAKLLLKSDALEQLRRGRFFGDGAAAKPTLADGCIAARAGGAEERERRTVRRGGEVGRGEEDGKNNGVPRMR